MYSDCIFCQRPFKANAAIESLQIGRRIAFDGAQGRLWVVCRNCERWNLVPVETRWEAIEEAERLFRDTRLRVSTEQIGLARLREGTELIRIGRPLRPEFAAWRYGDQFGRRRRKAIAIGTGAAIVIGSALTAGVVTGVVSLALLGQSGSLANLWVNWNNHRTLARIPTGEGGVLKVKQKQLAEARIGRLDDGSWWVRVSPGGKAMERSEFTGPDAERVAALLLPRLNASGASQRHVQEAVGEIERRGGAEEFMMQLIERPPLPSWLSNKYSPADGVSLGQLPRAHRLALEMALHEECEREALRTELRGLETAWRAEEEIAAIADDLLVPPSVRDRLASELRPPNEGAA